MNTFKVYHKGQEFKEFVFQASGQTHPIILFV